MKLLEYENWEDQREYLWNMYAIQMNDIYCARVINQEREKSRKKKEMSNPCYLFKICPNYETYKCESLKFQGACRELANSLWKDYK